jgi:prophage regulatory protein
MSNDTSSSKALISRDEVLDLTSLSYSQVVRLERRGEFPRSYKIGDRRVAYLRREILDWINSKLTAQADLKEEYAL